MSDPLVLVEARELQLATVMARKGVESSLKSFDLPSGPRCWVRAGLTIIGTGPGVWLVVSAAKANDWPQALERRLGGLCSVCDQSGGYVVFHLAGAGARALLQRGLAVDLHPDVFVAGSAATSQIGQIGVIVWRAEETPAFDVAVFRSYAASFRRWIEGETL